MDLKVIAKFYKRHKFILCIIDEVTNYLITVPIHKSRSDERVDELIENMISKYCMPDYIIMDQDRCIHVNTHELFVKEAQHKGKNSGTLHLSIITGRTWYKVTIYHPD